MFDSFFSFINTLSGNLVEILIGVVGFIGVLIALRADRKIKIVEFIAQYNLTFLTENEFTSVERKLEGCNDAYHKYAQKDKQEFQDYCDKVFGTKNYLFESDEVHRKFDENGAITEDYQRMVNYLVYLESFSTLINQRRVSIKDIDDLFGYRFFIAVNNPVFQENELIPYQQYYQGIIKAYKKWTNYYQRHKIEIFIKDPITQPMCEFALSERLGQIKRDIIQRECLQNQDQAGDQRDSSEN